MRMAKNTNRNENHKWRSKITEKRNARNQKDFCQTHPGLSRALPVAIDRVQAR